MDFPAIERRQKKIGSQMSDPWHLRQYGVRRSVQLADGAALRIRITCGEGKREEDKKKWRGDRPVDHSERHEESAFNWIEALRDAQGDSRFPVPHDFRLLSLHRFRLLMQELHDGGEAV